MQVTSRGLARVSHDDQGQAGARRVQSAGFLFGASGASHRRGVPRNQPKVSILVQKDQDRQDGGRHQAHRSITTRGFSQAKTTFVRIDCTTCPLSNPAVVESLPAHIWEEYQGHYI